MGIPLPFRLTLASGSQGRRYLLERAGYAFDVKPSNVPEPTEAVGGNIRDYVMHVAWTKAAAVGPTVADGIVLAADSVGWIDGHVIGKPEDAADARRILQTLSGRVHELWTGVCLWRAADGWQVQWQEVSRVQMKELSAGEIDAYLKTRQWEGCSGAYAIQEEGDPYLTVVEGSVTNVIGLPMESLATAFAFLVGAGR
jgi:septum formation protein